MIIGFWHLCRVCQHKSPSVVKVLAVACLCGQHTANGTCQNKESIHKKLVLVNRWAKLAIFSKKTKAFCLFLPPPNGNCYDFSSKFMKMDGNENFHYQKTTSVYRRIKHHFNLNLRLTIRGCWMILRRIKDVAHQRMNLTKTDQWASANFLYIMYAYMRTHTRRRKNRPLDHQNQISDYSTTP